MNRLVLLLTVATAGCAPNAVVMQKAPVFMVQSDRPAIDLQLCVAPMLEGYGQTIATQVGAERRLTLGGRHHTVAVVSIIGEHPATVELRQAFAVNKVLRDRIRACAENRLPS